MALPSKTEPFPCGGDMEGQKKWVEDRYKNVVKFYCAYKILRSRMVKEELVFEEFINFKFNGTGFFINKAGVFLTCKHCVVNENGSYPAIITVLQDQGDGQLQKTELGTARVLRIFVEEDLAILKLETVPPGGTSPVQLGQSSGSHRIRLDHPLHMLGYPDSNQVVNSVMGRVKALDVSMKDELRGPFTRHKADISMCRGGSGGPMYCNEVGWVIGMYTDNGYYVEDHAKHYEPGAAYFIPIDVITRLLDVYGCTPLIGRRNKTIKEMWGL